MKFTSTSRRLLAVVAAASLSLGLSACGSSSDASGNEPVELRFSWWGNPERAEITQEAIDLFEKKNPDIKVQPDFVAFDSYFDKLATKVAAGDAPDVITLGGAYPREYAARGVLLDMSQVSDQLDLSKLPETALASGKFEGAQYGVPTGVNSYGLIANPQVFKDAGVPMPDDDTWTWDDYVEISNKISENTSEKVVGTVDPSSADVFDLYARQRGESLYSKDGKLNIAADTVENWWEMTLGLSKSGAAPEASLTTELAGQAAPEQSLMGRNKAAMEFAWSNQLAAYQKAAGEPLKLLRAPGESQQDPGMWLQASQIYSIAADSEHPEEAAKLVDFLINDPEAAKIIELDRGVPANPDVLKELQPQLSKVDQVQTEFVARMSKVAGPPLTIGPVGSTETRLIIDRLNAEVLFGRMTPAQAAKQFEKQVKSAISQ